MRRRRGSERHSRRRQSLRPEPRRRRRRRHDVRCGAVAPLRMQDARLRGRRGTGGRAVELEIVRRSKRSAVDCLSPNAHPQPPGLQDFTAQPATPRAGIVPPASARGTLATGTAPCPSFSRRVVSGLYDARTKSALAQYEDARRQFEAARWSVSRRPETQPRRASERCGLGKIRRRMNLQYRQRSGGRCD